MHPLLAGRTRFGFYLLGWAPIVVLLAALLVAIGGAAWPEALSALAAACLLYAFVCLSPWHLCRAIPVRRGAVPRTLLIQVAAALCAGVLFAAAAGVFLAVFARAYARPPSNRGLALLFGAGVLLYLFSVAIHYSAVAVELSREAEGRAVVGRMLAREAELKSLKAQVNPHFLFNSLNAVSALIGVDGQRAREMCVRLADFLRASLAVGDRETVPLDDELGLARRYLEIEQVRFGARLHVDFDSGEGCGACPVPAMLLQPLVENAIKHGVAGLLEGGWIRIQARRREDGTLSLAVENPFDPASPAPPGSGLGLANVKRRLHARFGNEARFEAGAVGDVYRVALLLPCDVSSSIRRA